MEIPNEQIAPELIQAIIAQAAARGLTVNDYLARLLTLAHERNGELALPDSPGFTAAQPLTPYELVEDIIGSIDSSVPDSDPDSQPRRSEFGAAMLKKHEAEVRRSSTLSRIATQQGMTSSEWVRQNFPNGYDSQGRRLSEVLDSHIHEEDSKRNGTH